MTADDARGSLEFWLGELREPTVPGNGVLALEMIELLVSERDDVRLRVSNKFTAEGGVSRVILDRSWGPPIIVSEKKIS